MLDSSEHEICPAKKSQIINNYKVFLVKYSCAENFMLSWVEHEKRFITSGPGRIFLEAPLAGDRPEIVLISESANVCVCVFNVSVCQIRWELD